MNENNIVNRIIPLKQYSFFIEIFFAMLIILFFAKKRKLFPLRVILALCIGFPFYYLPSLNSLSFNYSYDIVILVCFVFGLLLYDEKIFPILFSCIGAWGIQHITWNILGIAYDLIPDVAALSDAVLITIYYVVFITIYLLALLVIYKLKVRISFKKNQIFSFILAAIMIITTMYLSQAITTWSIPIRLYTILVALLSLIIMVGYPYLSDLILKEKELHDEKTMLEQMLDLQAEQQKLSKEATDILNIKFHDMKHQLLMMRNMDEDERNRTSDEIEKSIDIYTDIARTGNEAMDIVITQKSLICTSNNIRFTYILSGECITFMNKSDITSLYGNIIDNAIEATKKEEGEYRLIKLKTYRQNGLILIQEENYCHTKIRFGKDGLPLSTKKDKVNHGYGSKSIRYIVEKYHGQMKIDHENDIYHLSIIIPSIEEKN
jgi:signal transduction histidine kinase